MPQLCHQASKPDPRTLPQAHQPLPEGDEVESNRKVKGSQTTNPNQSNISYQTLMSDRVHFSFPLGYWSASFVGISCVI